MNLYAFLWQFKLHAFNPFTAKFSDAHYQMHFTNQPLH